MYYYLILHSVQFDLSSTESVKTLLPAISSDTEQVLVHVYITYITMYIPRSVVLVKACNNKNLLIMDSFI